MGRSFQVKGRIDAAVVEDRLLDIVSEIIEIEKEKIRGKNDINIFKAFDVDSLLGLEIVAEVEKVFDIKINDEEIEGLESINGIRDLVTSYLDGN